LRFLLQRRLIQVLWRILLERCNEGHIMVYLNELDQLKGVLEKVEINSKSFGTDVIMVDFNPLF